MRRFARLPGLHHLRGRPLVISASEVDAVDSRVSAIARALGVPVNVPDRPHLCTFALPAIVDRDEVTIAIGTEGTAPVLAQRLRARLERDLHPRLGILARLAGEFRETVSSRLADAIARRRFWERFFDGEAAEAVLADDEPRARRLINQAIDEAEAGIEPQRPQGRVLLVGAGPGDPELLTLKAVRALKAADVIFYDALVGEGVFEHARREAELIPVGKRAGAHSVSQDQINRLLVAYANEGKTVVRLKGGDPFIFGRGGEELEALRAAGIATEVVPGITAAVAAAASLQVPLTHREHGRSLTFVSGHAANSDAPDFDGLDLAALARGKATLALYMGVRTAGQVAHELLAAGWSPATPVIAVEHASRADERRVSSHLAELAGTPEALGLNSPAVLIFGEIAGLEMAGVVERASSLPELRRAHG